MDSQYRHLRFAACLAAGLCAGMAAVTVAGAAEVQSPFARQALAENDGWAAAEGGTRGGADATAEHVYLVESRKQLVDALAAGDAAKIIQVKGTINLSSDDSGKELVEKDYADPEYDFDKYVETYKPEVWNVQPFVKGRPPEASGPLEDARKRSAQAQKAVVVIEVPSNTTIIGLGDDAKIVKGNLRILTGTDNVIIRNIAFSDSYDYFPEWSPRDSFSTKKGAEGCQETYVDAKTGPQMCRGGRWNSEYDLISIEGATHVWIDHCSFDDGDRPDKMHPPVFPAPHNEFEQKVQHHDGLVDVIKGANYVTISNSVFRDHDKAHLVGSSDKLTSDGGKLKVTFRHNHYINAMQRTPRVRYGEVHVYNSLFEGDRGRKEYPFRYAFGIGAESHLYSEANVFALDDGATAADAVANYRGKVFFDQGSILNGKDINLFEAFNAEKPDKAFGAEIGWKPALYVAPPLPAAEVAAYVKANAGPGKLND